MSQYHYKYNNKYTAGNDGSPGPGPHTPPGGSPFPPRPPREDIFGVISWVIDVALIIAAAPVGLVLTVLHALGTDPVTGLLHRIVYGRRDSAAPQEQPQQSPPKESVSGNAAASALRRVNTGSEALKIFGCILTGIGLLGVIGGAVTNMTLWRVITFACLALSGGAMLISGRRARRKKAGMERCLSVTGQEGIVDMRELSRTLGTDLARTDKLLTEMIDRGLYGSRAYIDHKRCLLVISPEQMRDVYKAEDEAAARENAARTGTTGYEELLARIRQANAAIDDERMSERIRRIETATAAIFDEVRLHPEKRPEIDRFMNYYLPTTLKLLSSYARIEHQGVSGENMAKAKQDIEGIADTLVQGFEKQLDRLYRSEAMDIAGDVKVVENMMKQDGLTGTSDFGQVAGGNA